MKSGTEKSSVVSRATPNPASHGSADAAGLSTGNRAPVKKKQVRSRSDAPINTNTHWFFNQGEALHGPEDLSVLKQKLRSGQLTQDTVVLHAWGDPMLLGIVLNGTEHYKQEGTPALNPPVNFDVIAAALRSAATPWGPLHQQASAAPVQQTTPKPPQNGHVKAPNDTLKPPSNSQPKAQKRAPSEDTAPAPQHPTTRLPPEVPATVPKTNTAKPANPVRQASVVVQGGMGPAAEHSEIPTEIEQRTATLSTQHTAGDVHMGTPKAHGSDQAGGSQSQQQPGDFARAPASESHKKAPISQKRATLVTAPLVQNGGTPLRPAPNKRLRSLMGLVMGNSSTAAPPQGAIAVEAAVGHTAAARSGSAATAGSFEAPQVNPAQLAATPQAVSRKVNILAARGAGDPDMTTPSSQDAHQVHQTTAKRRKAGDQQGRSQAAGDKFSETALPAPQRAAAATPAAAAAGAVESQAHRGTLHAASTQHIAPSRFPQPAHTLPSDTPVFNPAASTLKAETQSSPVFSPDYSSLSPDEYLMDPDAPANFDNDGHMPDSDPYVAPTPDHSYSHDSPLFGLDERHDSPAMPVSHTVRSSTDGQRGIVTRERIGARESGSREQSLVPDGPLAGSGLVPQALPPHHSNHRHASTARENTLRHRPTADPTGSSVDDALDFIGSFVDSSAASKPKMAAADASKRRTASSNVGNNGREATANASGAATKQRETDARQAAPGPPDKAPVLLQGSQPASRQGATPDPRSGGSQSAPLTARATKSASTSSGRAVIAQPPAAQPTTHTLSSSKLAGTALSRAPSPQQQQQQAKASKAATATPLVSSNPSGARPVKEKVPYRGLSGNSIHPEKAKEKVPYTRITGNATPAENVTGSRPAPGSASNPAAPSKAPVDKRGSAASMPAAKPKAPASIKQPEHKSLAEAVSKLVPVHLAWLGMDANITEARWVVNDVKGYTMDAMSVLELYDCVQRGVVSEKFSACDPEGCDDGGDLHMSLGAMFKKYEKNIQGAAELANGGPLPQPSDGFGDLCHSNHCNWAHESGTDLPAFGLYDEPRAADDHPPPEQPQEEEEAPYVLAPGEDSLKVPFYEKAVKAKLSHAAVPSSIKHKNVAVHLLAFNLEVNVKSQGLVATRRQPGSGGGFAPASPWVERDPSPIPGTPRSVDPPTMQGIQGLLDPSLSANQDLAMLNSPSADTDLGLDASLKREGGVHGAGGPKVRHFGGPAAVERFSVGRYLPAISRDED